MQLTEILSLLAVLSAVQGLPAEPVNGASSAATTAEVPSLFRRLGDNSGRNPANAKDMEINCADTPDTCDADAYAMLCLGAPRVLQRDMNKSHKRSHYSKSGARYQPFRTPEARNAYGTRIPHANWLSPEEFPFESANVQNEAQRVVFLFPVPDIEQSRQGGALNRDYTQWHVADGDWFHIRRFANCNRPYCVAFNSDDASVCQKKFKPGKFDWANFVWKRISAARKPLQYAFAGGAKTKRDVLEADALIIEEEPVATPERRDVLEADALIIGDDSVGPIERRDVLEDDALIIGEEWEETLERRQSDPDLAGLTPTDRLPPPVVVQQSWDDGVN